MLVLTIFVSLLSVLVFVPIGNGCWCLWRWFYGLGDGGVSVGASVGGGDDGVCVGVCIYVVVGGGVLLYFYRGSLSPSPYHCFCYCC